MPNMLPPKLAFCNTTNQSDAMMQKRQNHDWGSFVPSDTDVSIFQGKKFWNSPPFSPFVFIAPLTNNPRNFFFTQNSVLEPSRLFAAHWPIYSGTPKDGQESVVANSYKKVLTKQRLLPVTERTIALREEDKQQFVRTQRPSRLHWIQSEKQSGSCPHKICRIIPGISYQLASVSVNSKSSWRCYPVISRCILQFKQISNEGYLQLKRNFWWQISCIQMFPKKTKASFSPYEIFKELLELLWAPKMWSISFQLFTERWQKTQNAGATLHSAFRNAYIGSFTGTFATDLKWHVTSFLNSILFFFFLFSKDSITLFERT